MALYRVIVDPEVRKQLDQTIQEARQALEDINKGGETLAAEERAIRTEDNQYKKKFVSCSPFTNDITRLNSLEGNP